MDSEQIFQQAVGCLNTLCREIQERPVGSEGNRRASRFIAEEFVSSGWKTETPEFDAIEWEEEGARLRVGGVAFTVLPSPYSLGCAVKAPLAVVANIRELEKVEAAGKVLLLRGEIAREQLMPKNFVFYNPEEHRKIVALLEEKRPAAIVTATGRNADLAGGLYPFPLIEDGDFDIPSVYMTEEEGSRLAASAGRIVNLESFAARRPAKGFNVIARKGSNPAGRVVVTAHLDAKRGTPGAIDNATGVTVLVLLARLLGGYRGERMIELVALNGEDYYAVPGQMLYIRRNRRRFGDILLNVNIDGAGYREGPTIFSFFDLPAGIGEKARAVVDDFPGIEEGPPWPQGDHSIFIQQGCPAIAVSSRWLIENMSRQEITHTPKDNLEIVNPGKLVEIARALERLLR